MAERHERWLLISTTVLVFGLLLGAAPILTATVSSAPPAQEQPGEDLYLDYGNDVTRTLYAYDESEVFETFVFRVHLPAGAQLTVWLGEDAQGGCYSEGLLFIGSSQVGYTTVGPAPSSWSTPIVATVSTGYAQLAFRGYDDCDASVTFPVEKYVRFKVGGPPPEPTTDTPTPTVRPEVIEVTPPTIDFWADQDHIVRGGCTTLHWRVENVQAVYYQGGGVSGHGDRQECPQQTTTYELYVVVYQAAEQLIDETRYVTVYVEEPITPTYTPTPSPTRTPTPSATLRASATPTGTPTRTPTATPCTPTPTRRVTPTPTSTSTMPTATPSPAPAPTLETKLLIVTNKASLNYYVGSATWNKVESWLDRRYGPAGYDVLDLSETFGLNTPSPEETDQHIEEQWERGSYWSIFILGGQHIVPFAEATNYAKDGDTLYTDDLYADFDDDWIPDTPLARLPDNGDIDLLKIQLTGSGDWWYGGFVMAQSGPYWARRYPEQFAAATNTQVVHAPPSQVSQLDGVNRAFTYFDLVGLQGSDVWYAPDPQTEALVPSFYSEYVDSAGVVISAADYGAYPAPCTNEWTGRGFRCESSIPISFLRNGSGAYIGTTVRNYRIPRETVTYGREQCVLWILGCSRPKIVNHYEGPGIAAFTESFLDHWNTTQDPLSAYYSAKVEMLMEAHSEALPEVTKMAQALVYYGVPSKAVTLTPPPVSEAPLYLVITDIDKLESRIGEGTWFSEIASALSNRLLDDMELLNLADLDHLGANPTWQQVDRAIHEFVGGRYGDIGAILILGGPRVVPFAEVDNPVFETCKASGTAEADCDDQDIVYTDDVYSDFNGDLMPDVPLARLPDGWSLDLIMGQLERDPGLSLGGAYLLGHHNREGQAVAIGNMIGANEHWSAPDDFTNVNSDDLEVQLSYFILHGSDSDPSTWWGEDLTGTLTTAIRTFEVEPADEVGIVVSAACYGAYLDGGQDPRDSLALRFLDEGARAFIGSTTSAYSCRFGKSWNLECNYSLYMGLLMKRLVDGEDPLMAYFNAKYDFLDRINEMSTEASKEKKALHSIVFYGLPPYLAPVIEF